MQSRRKPPKFHQQDWSQFDFSRWHLDGVTLDAAAAVVAGLSERLFNSDEWREHFKSTLPALERQALGVFKSHSQNLREQKKAVAEDFDKRVVAAQERSNDFRKSVEIAAAPPVVQASPNAFHMAVKVTGKDGSLGLPGLMVQIAHPRDKKSFLARSITDENGNAVLTVPEDVAREVDKTDTALEVLTPESKVLLEVPGAVCVRLNQVETKVLATKEPAEIAPLKQAALAIRAERELRIRALDAQVQTLKQDREERLHDLDCKLQDNEAIIADFEKKDDVARIVEAAAPPATPGQPGVAPAPPPAASQQPKGTPQPAKDSRQQAKESRQQTKEPPQQAKEAARQQPKEAPQPKETPSAPKSGRKKK